jgi:phosphoglycolate phosphatase-like HAD superfamily hydrolase
MVHDIEAGKNAGIKTVAITSGYDPVERLRAANPDIIIHDIIELLDILR